MKRLIILLIAIFFITNANSQDNAREANHHFKIENYPVALRLFTALYNKDTTNNAYNYNLGVCHLNTNSNPEKALFFLKKEFGKLKDDQLYLFELGKAYSFNYNFDKAKEYYSMAINKNPKNTEFVELCQLHIKMADNAILYTKSPLDISFINLGKGVNSEMDETTPIINADGTTLYFTTNLKYDTKILFYTSDVSVSYLEDGTFKKAKIASGINSVDDEFIAGVSMNDERVYYQLQGFDAYQDIFSADIKGKNFSNKTLLNPEVNSRDFECAACESANGDTLFFSSTGNNSTGGFDIFYSLKLPNGLWSSARNIGPAVNTIYDENFPVLSADGSKLYFCSNNDKSMGGYDIFVSNINPATREFSTPRNIGYPLNDVFDNKTIAFSHNERYAYVSAIRDEGFGYNDIYRVVFNQQDPSVKIYILKLFTGSAELPVPLAQTDTSIIVSVYSKNKSIFGKHAFDKNNSRVTIALPPGSYTVSVTGTLIKPKDIKIVVPDVPELNKIEQQNEFFNLK